MYDDAWYNAFVPSSRRPPRRGSLLEQPNADEADVDTIEIVQPIDQLITRPPSPPLATVIRRVKSSGDTRHASKARKRASIDFQARPVKSNGGVNSYSEFDEWYNGWADALVEASHDKYQLYLDQLQLSRQHLDSILEDTAVNLDSLSQLSSSFLAVENQTTTFHTRCEGLLSEQNRLTILADNMAENLKYYSLLDPLTRRLNAPGAGHLVRGGDFPQMLLNLDKCLDFMQAHPNHNEASMYQSRYRLLLTRALTLIRVYFTNTLRELAADVSKRIVDRQLNDTTMTSLLYAKFRVGAADLKQLGLEIQKRASPPLGSEPGTQGEYQSLMNELYQSYSAARGRLLVPLIRKRLAEISTAPSTSKDLLQFARSSVGYIRGICLDEFDLWHEWFDGDGGLYEFLEAICEPLYDYLRPRTIRETQLPKLCDLCSLLQVRFMQDPDEDMDVMDMPRLDFASLIRPALEDVQTRLVFVALAVLREDIERFKPKPADLESAGRNSRVPLSGSRSKVVPLSGRNASSDSLQSPMPKTPLIVEEENTDPMDLKWHYDTGAPAQEWYPTLRKAIWLLSRIYRLVNSTVFDDLAHQIVHQTTISLQKAALALSAKKDTADTQLFLLKQLLILKQQIIAFDIEFVTPDVNFDFSNVTNTFWELRERGGLFNPGNLLRLVGGTLMPRVVENMLDAKADLDGRLRSVINDFTNGFALRMTAAIAASTAGGGRKQEDLTGAATAVQTTRAAIKREVPLLRAKLDDFLDDVRIKETLVGAVEDQALQYYEEFFERYMARKQANGGGGGKAISKKGKGREDDVWDPDTFADWTGGVFGVGRVGFGLGIEGMEGEEEMEVGGI